MTRNSLALPGETARVVRTVWLICFAFLAGAAAGGYAAQAFGNRALWCDILLLALTVVRVQSRVRLPSTGGCEPGQLVNRIRPIRAAEKDAALES